MSSSIIVSNIASITSKDHLRDFFTFCGNIKDIDYNESANSAVITFEKPTAAKTALMLNGGTLDGSHLTVTSDSVHPDQHDDEGHHDEIRQEDKPRAGIAAEYLAKGYVLSDNILHRAIELDQKQGISQRFLAFLQSLDTKLGSKLIGEDKTISGRAQELAGQGAQRAKTVDEQHGVSTKANDFYSKAIQSPLGKKVFSFYTDTSKQVADIHEEARRIADQHKATAATPGDATGSGTEPKGTSEKTTEAPTVV